MVVARSTRCWSTLRRVVTLRCCRRLSHLAEFSLVRAFDLARLAWEVASRFRVHILGFLSRLVRRPRDFKWCSRGLCGSKLVADGSSRASCCRPPNMPPLDGSKASTYWPISVQHLWTSCTLGVERRPSECRVLNYRLGTELCDCGAPCGSLSGPCGALC